MTLTKLIQRIFNIDFTEDMQNTCKELDREQNTLQGASYTSKTTNVPIIIKRGGLIK